VPSAEPAGTDTLETQTQGRVMGGWRRGMDLF